MCFGGVYFGVRGHVPALDRVPSPNDASAEATCGSIAETLVNEGNNVSQSLKASVAVLL